MQFGGALANLTVRAELPSAAGQGVSPVRVAPAVAAVVLGLPAAVVLDVELTLFFLLPPREVMKMAPMMASTITPPAIARRRSCFCFWARSSSSWRACR